MQIIHTPDASDRDPRPLADCLRNNHQLLNTYLQAVEIADGHPVLMNELLEKDFLPCYFTAMSVDSGGLPTFYCFELGWTEYEPGRIRLSVAGQTTIDPAADMICYPF